MLYYIQICIILPFLKKNKMNRNVYINKQNNRDNKRNRSLLEI